MEWIRGAVRMSPLKTAKEREHAGEAKKEWSRRMRKAKKEWLQRQEHLKGSTLLEDKDGRMTVRPGNMGVTSNLQQMCHPEPEHSTSQCIPSNTNLYETRACSIGAACLIFWLNKKRSKEGKINKNVRGRTKKEGIQTMAN